DAFSRRARPPRKTPGRRSSWLEPHSAIERDRPALPLAARRRTLLADRAPFSVTVDKPGPWRLYRTPTLCLFPTSVRLGAMPPLRGIGLVAAVLLANSAHAHGIAGNRYFPGTLAFDDPAVADELVVGAAALKHPAEDGLLVNDYLAPLTFMR